MRCVRRESTRCQDRKRAASPIASLDTSRLTVKIAQLAPPEDSVTATIRLATSARLAATLDQPTASIPPGAACFAPPEHIATARRCAATALRMSSLRISGCTFLVADAFKVRTL